jgi:hypothetical protein
VCFQQQAPSSVQWSASLGELPAAKGFDTASLQGEMNSVLIWLGFSVFLWFATFFPPSVFAVSKEFVKSPRVAERGLVSSVENIPVTNRASYPNQEVSTFNVWKHVVYIPIVGKKPRGALCRFAIRKDYLRQTMAYSS